MEAKREIFKREASEFIYGPSEENNYSGKETRGIYNKIGLKGIVRCYQQVCNHDPDLEKLFNALIEYSKINPTSASAYDYESLLLDEIETCADKALESTDREYRIVRKELSYYRKMSGSLRPDEKRKSDAEGLMKYERAENGKVAVMAIKIYADELVFGTLPSSECPEGTFHDYDPQVSSIGHPVFTHDPIGVDITDSARGQSPFFVGLSNYVKSAPKDLMSMFCDCGDGSVTVRLWDPETMQPVYVSVEKDDVYFDWIIVGQNPALWPGMICRALNECGYDAATSDPELLMRMITGKKDAFSPEFLTRFVPEAAKKTSDTAAYGAYFRCLNDICIALLGTMNVNIQETEKAFMLFEGVKVAIGDVFTNFSDNLDLLRPAMDYLAQVTKDYREYEDPSPRRKRRLEICASIDQLIDIFNDPDLRQAPTRIFRSLIGQNLK